MWGLSHDPQGCLEGSKTEQQQEEVKGKTLGNVCLKYAGELKELKINTQD